MGMRAIPLALYDAPDEVHASLSYLRDNALHLPKWHESEGSLTLKNRNQVSLED
jgi:hypothetical protein